MKNAFVANLFGFVLGAIVPVSLIYIGVPILSGASVEHGHWVKENLERNLTAASAKPGKLLILSGSNGRFGFSAKYIEEKYGILAMNLAANAGLGREYLLYYGRKAVRENDIVVLPLEYQLYGPEKSDASKTIQVIAYDQSFLSVLPFSEKLKFLAGVDALDWARLIKGKLIPDRRISGLLNPERLNDWGDQVGNRADAAKPQRVKALTRSFRSPFQLDPSAIDDILAFDRFVRQLGGRVVIAYPNILRTVLETRMRGNFAEDIKLGFEERGIPVIGNPFAATFEERDAFDSEYHQNSEGQIRSSERLIRDLVQNGIVRLPASRAR